MESRGRQPWEVTSEKVEAAIRKIIEVSQADGFAGALRNMRLRNRADNW